MTQDRQSTRRAFLKGGAIAAAPLAAVGAAAVGLQSEHEAKLARLQSEAAVRDLHQAWLRRVNTAADASDLFAERKSSHLAGTVTRIDPDHAGAADELRLAADGLTASARYACVVETQVELAPNCTLAQMRHAQGEGHLRQSERRLLKADYVKTGDRWAIAGLKFEPV